MGDKRQWEPYSPSACAVLDSAVSSGKTSVALSLGSGTAYEVDLKKMVQINPVTKYKRKVRCQNVKAGVFFAVNFLSSSLLPVFCFHKSSFLNCVA